MRLSLLVFVTFITSCLCVKSELFKKCDQSGFCNRNRHYANQISESKNSYYSIDTETLKFNGPVVNGNIQKKFNESHIIDLPFQIDLLAIGGVRIRIDEDRSKIQWNKTTLQKERFSDAWKYTFVKDPELLNENYQLKELEDGSFSYIFNDYEIEINSNDFKIVILYDNKEQLVLNDRSFFNLEHLRTEESNAENIFPEELDFNGFRDDFKDSKADSLPFGPESIAIDVSFKEFKHVYGIPEHADTLALKDTTDSEPYRLYNVDIFEYEIDSRLPMYGSIPLLIAHKSELSIGFFWVNSADTYIDIKKDEDSVKTHWISENGILDLIILIGKNPSDITKNYSTLTGTTTLPQLFSLGYHQCRWNYNDEEDILSVTSNMDKYEIPYDVIWLDIEYTDAKKYFTWKKETFPDPVKMMSKLDETGRTLVTIIDPHIKVDYFVSNELSKQHLALLNKDGGDFHGHCWPGESMWIDTFNPKSQAFWNDLFKNGTEFSGDATNLHIWNDMNEPSVFNGPETTSPKDLITYGDVEIRSNHNLYGLTFHEATYKALKERYDNKRPFILTRAYFSGSQKTSAMWTGDNMSKWEYLKLSIPMILTQNIVGYPFSGADVGGFFGNPSKELLTRWYQAGIWYPFFRAHAHIDSRRREPWLAGEPYTSLIRDAVRIRYQLLPLFYTKFYETSIDGSPILEPVFYRYPQNEESFEIEDQFFLDNLLIKPVTEEGAVNQTIYLPDDEIYYDYETYSKIQGKGNKVIDAPLEKIPVLIKGGSIIPRKDRYRRSSKLMKFDPYTLIISLNKENEAQGKLYIDDEETFNYEQGEYLYIDFQLKDSKLTSEVISGAFKTNIKVEKILIIGDIDINNSNVKQNENTWNIKVEDKKSYKLIKNPGVLIGENWSIDLE